jgi:hypothetical protein
MSAAVSCSHAAVAATARASSATRRTPQSAARLPARKQLCGARVASGAACARVARGSVTTHAGITPVKFSFGAFPTPFGCPSPGATRQAAEPSGYPVAVRDSQLSLDAHPVFSRVPTSAVNTHPARRGTIAKLRTRASRRGPDYPQQRQVRGGPGGAQGGACLPMDPTLRRDGAVGSRLWAVAMPSTAMATVSRCKRAADCTA